MNSNTIKTIGLCALGGLVGAGVGYGVATFVVENILEAEEEVVYDGEEIQEEEEIETVLPEKGKKIKKDKVNYNDMYKVDENPDLAKLAEKYKKGTDVDSSENLVDEEDELEIDEDMEDEIDRTKPYLIDREQFETEFNDEHKKVFLTFYDEEEVLEDVTDLTLITNDPEKFLGPIALTSFGEDENEPDYVFVRNETLEIDYKIQVSYEPYVKPVKEVKPTKKKREVNE